MPPIVKGIGRTPFPKPQRHYIMVGERIETKHFNGNTQDEELLMGVRHQVEADFKAMFKQLEEHRKNDKPDEWWRWLLKKI